MCSALSRCLSLCFVGPPSETSVASEVSPISNGPRTLHGGRNGTNPRTGDGEREEAGHVTIVTSRTGRTEGLPHARRRWAQPAGTSILYSYGSARLPRTGSPAWQPRSVYARAGTRAPGPPPRVLAHASRFPRPHTDTRAGMAVTGLRLEGSRVPDWPVPALASECGPPAPSVNFFY